MYSGHRISAIIPARNESLNIERVVCGLKQLRNNTGHALIDEIMVCDNGSTDDTAIIARQFGARVVQEDKPGYGAACLCAVAAISESDIYLFVDGDDSVNYQEALDLLRTIDDGADLAIGARKQKLRERGAMSLPQRMGNSLAVHLIKLLWDEEISDLGPFRAIREPAYRKLAMQDEAFGWTVEMQVKAIQLGLRTEEVPVSCRRRLGVSKISGSVSGIIDAAQGILGTIALLWLQQKRTRSNTAS